MLNTFARIIIILFTVGVYGSIDYQPSAFIKDTKLIGSLHQNNEVEMFLGIPFAAPPINDLRWESLLLGFLIIKKKLLLISLGRDVFKTKELLIGIKG